MVSVIEAQAPRRAVRLLERDQELAELAALHEDTRSRRGRLLLVEGPAGIGKTQLLREVRRLAEVNGVRLLSARGSELERDFAFGVVRQLFELLLARASTDERARLLDGVARLAEPVFSAVPARPTSDPAYGTLRGLYWLLANAAEEGPLVLAIDDSQWADEPSLRFLHFVSTRLEGLPVGVVLAARTEGSAPRTALLGQLKLAATRPVLRPSPLSDSAVGVVVRSRLGAAISSAFCEACHEATRGNPFLLDTLVTELAGIDAALDELDPSVVRSFKSDRLATAVVVRIEGIHQSAPGLARSAAVLGERGTILQAAEVAGLDAHESRALARRLVDAEVLEEIEPLRFVHPLVRSAIYEAIPVADRGLLHARAADVLSRAGADPESVAAHLLATDPASNPEAVRALRAAAAMALSRGAPDVAARYLRRAIAEPPDEADRIAVIGELGVAASLDGHAEGLDYLRTATAEAGPGPLRADLALRLANALLPRGEIAEAAAAIEKALGDSSEAEDEHQLRLEATLAALGQWAQSTYANAERRMQKLEALAGPDSQSGRMILAALSYRRLLKGGPKSDAFALASAAIAGGLLADEQTDSANVCDALCAPAYTDHFDLAGTYIATALAEARARGRIPDVVLALTWGAVLAYRRGRIVSAEAQAREAIAIAELGSFASGTVMFTAAGLCRCLIDQGRLDEAQDVLENAGCNRAVPDSVMGVCLLLAKGGLLLARGNAEAAVPLLRDVGQRSVGWMDRTFVLSHRTLLALGLFHLGELAEARRLAAEELELARNWGTPSAVGAAQRVVGLIADREARVELLREAVVTLDGSGAKLEHAHALADLGSALRRDGKRTEARDSLARGLELAQICGATALADHAEAELRAAGARPRRRLLSGVGSLTPSEFRVAEMAAEGMTNKEIAQALFVTLRTVEMHLSRSYSKLDISSRGGLCAALAADAETSA